MDSFFIDKFNFINAKYRKILTVQCSGGGAVQNPAFFCRKAEPNFLVGSISCFMNKKSVVCMLYTYNCCGSKYIIVGSGSRICHSLDRDPNWMRIWEIT